MVHKPTPVQKMRQTAAAGWKRDDNLRRFGSVYPPGELERSLIAVAVLLLLAAAVAVVVLIG